MIESQNVKRCIKAHRSHTASQTSDNDESTYWSNYRVSSNVVAPAALFKVVKFLCPFISLQFHCTREANIGKTFLGASDILLLADRLKPDSRHPNSVLLLAGGSPRLRSRPRGHFQRENKLLTRQFVIHRIRDILDRIFGCWHRNISRPFTISGRTYEVCLRCGKQFAYFRADLGYRTLGHPR